MDTATLATLGFKRYASAAEIAIGDIVTMLSDVETPGFNAFASSIVERVENGNVRLARPIVRVDAVTRGTWISAETVTVPADRLISAFAVYTTGHSLCTDNRAY